MFGRTTFMASCLAFLGTLANAHMIMNTPIPYGGPSPDNSPLLASGADFPCKFDGTLGAGTKIETMNHMKVGEPQPLAFTGSSVHGGGSCQVSLTTDKTPTKQSVWRVIHSMEGGCPSNVTGNLPTDSNGHGATVFHFSIPKSVPNGQYSLAWTWFNKIGNREMYMNCAPVTVTGGTDKGMSAFNSLPNMFVANVGNGCTTSHKMPGQAPISEINVKFPDPGTSLERYPGDVLYSPMGNCPTGQSSSSGGSSSPSPPAAPPAAPPASASSSASQPAYSPPASVGPAPSATPAPSSAPAYVPPPPASAPVSGGGSSPSGSCTGGSVSCTTPGSVVCIGADQFGLCDINNCAVPQALAAGTYCRGGTITKRYVPVRPAPGKARRAHALGRTFLA